MSNYPGLFHNKRLGNHILLFCVVGPIKYQDIYWFHKRDPNIYYHSGARVDLRVLTMKGYSTLTRDPELKPSPLTYFYQIQVILNISIWPVDRTPIYTTTPSHSGQTMKEYFTLTRKPELKPHHQRISIKYKWFLNRSIWPIDGTPIDTTIPGQSGLKILTMKMYSTLNRDPELKPLHQIHFDMIYRGVRPPLSWRYSQSITRSINRVICSIVSAYNIFTYFLPILTDRCFLESESQQFSSSLQHS